jgi:hypothetical protein
VFLGCGTAGDGWEALKLKIEVGDLTTCCIDEGGAFVELNFLDASGEPTSLRVPFDKAQAVTVTLSHLLTLALQRMTGTSQARFAFPLGGWRIEDTPGDNGVITTLSTEDGFEVSFNIPLEACSGLGWALKDEADRGSRDNTNKPDDLTKPSRLN